MQISGEEFDTDNRTYIGIAKDEDEEDRKKRERLSGYNTGRKISRKRTNKEQIRKEDALATVEAIASHLRLTDGQKTEAKMIFQDLESRGRGLELMAFSVCAVVVNQYVEDGLRYSPQREDNDELFEEFVENHDLSPLGAMNQVRREILG